MPLWGVHEAGGHDRHTKGVCWWWKKALAPGQEGGNAVYCPPSLLLLLPLLQSGMSGSAPMRSWSAAATQIGQVCLLLRDKRVHVLLLTEARTHSCPTSLRAAPHVLCVDVGADLYQGPDGIQVAPQGRHMQRRLAHLQQHAHVQRVVWCGVGMRQVL